MTPVSVKLNTLTVGSLQRIQNMADKGILAPGRRGVACGAGFVTSNQCSCTGPWTQDLMLYHGYLKVLNDFIFALMFCKWSLMGLQSMHQRLGTSIPWGRFSAICPPPLCSGPPALEQRLTVGCVARTYRRAPGTVKVCIRNCEQPLCLRTYTLKNRLKTQLQGKREKLQKKKKAFSCFLNKGPHFPQIM